MEHAQEAGAWWAAACAQGPRLAPSPGDQGFPRDGVAGGMPSSPSHLLGIARTPSRPAPCNPAVDSVQLVPKPWLG